MLQWPWLQLQQEQWEPWRQGLPWLLGLLEQQVLLGPWLRVQQEQRVQQEP